MAMKRKNRRHTLIVNNELQKRIILVVALWPTVAMVLAAAGVGILGRGVLEEAANGLSELPSLGLLITWIYAFVAIFAILVIRQATMFSHRVAGPSLRITASMRRIREGDIGFRVKLRKSDLNSEIAEELNLLLDWMNEEPPASAEHTDESRVQELRKQQSEEPAVPAEMVGSGSESQG